MEWWNRLRQETVSKPGSENDLRLLAAPHLSKLLDEHFRLCPVNSVVHDQGCDGRPAESEFRGRVILDRLAKRSGIRAESMVNLPRGGSDGVFSICRAGAAINRLQLVRGGA